MTALGSMSRRMFRDRPVRLDSTMRWLRWRSASPPARPATAAATVSAGPPALSAAWSTAELFCLSVPTAPFGWDAARLVRVEPPLWALPFCDRFAPFREAAPDVVRAVVLGVVFAPCAVVARPLDRVFGVRV